MRQTVVAILAFATLVGCDSTDDVVSGNPVAAQPVVDTSPVFNIQRSDDRAPDTATDLTAYRSLDGSQNNLLLPDMNKSHSQLGRMMAPNYADLMHTPAGAGLPMAREISNAVAAQPGPLTNAKGGSDFVWQWGQFLDHDLDLTEGVVPVESFEIPIPVGDPWFDPRHTGTVALAFNRSIYDPETGDATVNPRQQINEITGWIDASNVYGSDLTRARALRTLDGSGQLKTSAGNFLPYNVDGLANAGGSGAELFLAGDPRANEQLGLTAMHTLFVREHNRLAGEIATANPNLDGEEIYQRARRIVGAQMQQITYYEFLPVLLGADALAPYRGYDAYVDASIANEFSTAAYRLGHSMLSDTILRLDADFNPIESGHLTLKEAFFQPHRLLSEGDIDPIMRGLAAQVCESVDSFVIDDVRNTLFGPPGSGGFDLVALNIQRGRDHGLPGYNRARVAMGLAPRASFAEVTSDATLATKLASVYGSVDDIELWVGGLAEDTYGDSALGELFHHIVVRQFEALRDGDRFWYEIALPPSELAAVRNTRLADIIRRNTGIGDELSDNVFVVR
ncbi:MAG: peroxidase family protein [Pseudomonadota bacterium]